MRGSSGNNASRPPHKLSKFHTTLPPSDTAMRPIWLYTELQNAPTLKTHSAAADRNLPASILHKP
ncbi:hypothetical protein FPK46_27380, partial [Acinetobacter baumannii]|nr:hypothetical protein [Acinetobacter baumannii]